jgi:hypothetical protein
VRRALATGVAAVAFAAVPASGTAAPAPLTHVTVIGDSVLTAVLWNPQPLTILKSDLDVWMQVATCRRLTGESCPFEGDEAPTLIDLVGQLGHELGPNVVVVMGYNDPEETFGQSVEESVSALLDAGVKRILWATLREARPPYPGLNQQLRTAAARHPEVTLIDWDAYSRDHPEWFQNDGVHLAYPGAIAMATFLHESIVNLLVAEPTVATVSLPLAHLGARYAARLTVSGGTAPYRWKLQSGALPTGLRLGPAGLIAGTPTRRGRFAFVVSVTDARGQSVTARELLTVARLARP